MKITRTTLVALFWSISTVHARLTALFLSAALAVAFSFTSTALGQAKPVANGVQQADRLIEAMASRNKEPKLVTTEGNDRVPLFADKYDWPEQERVWQALQTVIKTKSDEMWWRLVAHAGDARYALTCDNDDNVDMTARNFSVGSLCDHIASTDLRTPYLRHLPEEATAEWRILPKSTFHPQDEFFKHKTRWAGKPLYLIQIEVCRRAIEQMASATGIRSAYGGESPARKFTAEEKATFTEAVTKEIQQLKRTGQAITSLDIQLPGAGNHPFDPKDVEKARKLYKERRK